MRLLFTILLLMGRLVVAGQTSIYVIGTVHQPSRKFNPDSIVRMLEKVKPDLILLELDSSSFDPEFNIINPARTNEIVGVKRFISKYQTPVRPYDIKSRNLTKGIVKIEGESLERLRLMMWELDTNQKQAYLDFVKSNEDLVSFLKKKPRDLNKKYTDDLVSRNQAQMYKGLLDIIESRKELQDLRVGFRQCGVYWDWRNRRMVENVLMLLRSDTSKYKTIVLFTGFFHRYYFLRELLPKQSQYGFVVTEYWREQN